MSKRDESILLWLALAFVLGLLILPISADALIDIVRYVHGGPRGAAAAPAGACAVTRSGRPARP